MNFRNTLAAGFRNLSAGARPIRRGRAGRAASGHHNVKMITRGFRWLGWTATLSLSCSLTFAQSQPTLPTKTNSVAGDVVALPQAHAHNDYEHTRPLREALELGFGSVEADIWLVNGQLLVAHERQRVTPERTLQALYLDPLREQIARNGGRVYRGGPTCTLLIDVKSDAAQTYEVLRRELAPYADLLTTFTPTNTTERALTVILSGSRAAELVAAEPVRFVALDGRLADLETNPPATLYPLISDNWAQYFSWRGRGPFPADQAERLRRWVRQAHEQGRRLRFWSAPDSPAGWRELQRAGVDVIGTDNLAGLAAFLHPPHQP